ncbi:MAG: ADP-ribosylglycohydrolase family protein [Bacilli bacterium]|nr:ADP-ribosylglycohydrolase family protein [Bacilli bacterium]
MWGSVSGDISGSIYEYSQLKLIKEIKDILELITKQSFFSDDTIFTVAIIEAIIKKQDYEKCLRQYGLEYIDYKPDFTPYFKTSFSPSTMLWLKKKKIGDSNGSGAMMKIAPIGYLFNTEEEVIKQARLATIPSHNSKEAIDCATIIARIIFLARKGYSKLNIIKHLHLNITSAPFLKFNTTCYETINNCLYAAFTSNSYEESIRKILAFGGDTDTNACIVGGMAEALYGMDSYLIEQIKPKLPEAFVTKIEEGYSLIKKLR